MKKHQFKHDALIEVLHKAADLHDIGGQTQALVVDDALFCGACHPRPHPVPLPELDA